MKSNVKSFYIILTIKIMLMNVLLNMRMFGLFSETSQEVTNNEMQEAYGEFVEQIRTISNGNDYSTTYRILAATRIEIALLETIPLYGQGGKMRLKSCSYKRYRLLLPQKWNC